MSDALVRRVVLLGNFATARGIQVLAPVAVASLLPLHAYGVIEWSHATATLISSVAMLGTASLIPLYLIRSSEDTRRPGNLRAACWHSIAMAVCFLVAACIAALAFGPGHPSVLVCVLASTLAGHGFLTGYFRASGRMATALYLEALPFGAMAVVALLIHSISAHDSLAAMAWSMGTVAVSLLLLVLGLSTTWRRMEIGWSTYLATLRAGLPIMAGGIEAVAATVSGRFGAGAFGGPETAGAFAALARIAALCIVVHQFIIIARYVDLYALPKEDLQRIGLMTNAFVALSCAALIGIALLPMSVLGPAFYRSLAEHREAAVWLIAQVVIWSCTSLNEIFVLRCGVVARAAALSGGFLAVALCVAAAALYGGASVTEVARWHTLVMLAVLVAQVVSLGESRVLFYRYWAAVGLAFFGVLALGWQALT